MIKAPKIELKKIIHYSRMSEETYCYTADLIVDGIKWGEVANRGHGGPDDFYGIDGKSWSDIAALNKRIAATMPPIEGYGMTLEQSLELICGELISAHLRKADFDRSIKRKALFIDPAKPGIVSYYPIPRGAKLPQLLAILRRDKPALKLLADMPRDEAFAAWLAATGGDSE